MKTKHSLTRCSKPSGKLEVDSEQGQPIEVNGWTVTGYRDARDRYFECARKVKTTCTIERWYTLP